MAATLYFVALALIAAILIGTGIADLAFWLTNHRTISEMLREHMSWFVVPVAITLSFLAALTIHLAYHP